MREIPLSRGLVTRVDAVDYERVSSHRWYAGDCGGKAYPRTSAGKKNKKMYMHRFIMDPPSGFQVDHISGDTLDNRRSNLRICTQPENRRNYSGNNAKSGYKGVRQHPGSSVWRARIKLNKKEHHLGTFLTKELAAKAYNDAALLYHGEFAWLNKISETP